MPTYDYRCDSCGYEFEQFQLITARPLKVCPNCKRARLQRLIGSGGGIIFKGSGFYETDYRSEAYKQRVEAEKKAACPASEDKPTKKAAKKTASTKACARSGSSESRRASERPAR